MSKKRFSPEDVVNKLREADVLIAKGQTAPAADESPARNRANSMEMTIAPAR